MRYLSGALVFSIMFLMGCAALPPERNRTVLPVVRGQVVFAEPRVLPKSSTLELTIADPTGADGGLVARERQPVTEGEAPMEFAIQVQPGALNPAKEYLLLATIRSADRTLMSNLTLPSRFPGAEDNITVVLRPEVGF